MNLLKSKLTESEKKDELNAALSEVISNEEKVHKILANNGFKIIERNDIKIENVELVKIKHKYDCGVAVVYNLLKSTNIEYDYYELEKKLITTKLWGTFPKNIESFLLNYKDINFKIGLALISCDKFYGNGIDYGHYINIIGYENKKYIIFDPWDGIYYEINEKDFENLNKNVLIGGKQRFNNIYFGKKFI